MSRRNTVVPDASFTSIQDGPRVRNSTMPRALIGPEAAACGVAAALAPGRALVAEASAGPLAAVRGDPPVAAGRIAPGTDAASAGAAAVDDGAASTGSDGVATLAAAPGGGITGSEPPFAPPALSLPRCAMGRKTSTSAPISKANTVISTG